MFIICRLAHEHEYIVRKTESCSIWIHNLYDFQAQQQYTKPYTKQSLHTHTTHQLEKLPPGELVTTSSVIPMALFIANIFTVKNPKNGKMTNCKKTPMPNARLFRSCFRMRFRSTVADMPKTRKKRRMWPSISVA